jgi:DNA-binding XRE family transcriptional regulator
MYGRILRQLRESKGRGQADVARSVGISPSQLARLEASQRGLYLEDFVSIAEALGEKPGNLLPNDLGDIGHLNVRPGGVWRLVMHGPDGVDYPNKIVFIEVVKPQRLVYTHGGDGEDEQRQFHV